MDDGFLERIENTIKDRFFTDGDLKILFRDKSAAAIYNALTYYLKKKNIERYKRGLYSLSLKKNKTYCFSKFKLANKLVLHSYISFESALSHHGLIPEAVYETTSACLLKNKVFTNSLGVFSFTFSPLELFYLGVEKDKQTDAKIANPVRALFDLVYVKRVLYADVKELENDLRIDLEELSNFLHKFAASEILEIGELYKKKSTRNLANILIRDLI